MIDSIYVISLYAADIASTITFLFSVIYCYRDFNPPYLRTFPIYCFSNILVELITFVFINPKGSISKGISNSVAYNFFTVFELAYLSWFLTLFIRSRITKRIVWILNGIFFLHFILFSHRFGFRPKDAAGYLLECFILIIPCLVYFRELFTEHRSFNVTREPSFWIIIALLFYFSLSIPTILFNTYCQTHKMGHVFSNTIYSINNYAQILSSILIIKGFRCRIKQPY